MLSGEARCRLGAGIARDVTMTPPHVEDAMMRYRSMSLGPFLALLVAACGGAPGPVDRGGDTDTGEPTTSTHTTPAPMSGTVTVHAFHRLEEDMRPAVMVADRAGVFRFSRVMTESPIVLDEVPVGGFVTVARGTGGRVFLETIGGVQAGGTLHFGTARWPDVDAAAIGTVDVSLTDPGIAHVWSTVDTPCGPSTDFEGLPAIHHQQLRAHCAVGPFDILGALRGEQSQIVAFAHALDVSLKGTAPARSASVTLDTWIQDFGTLGVRYTTSLDTTDTVNLHGRAGRGPVIPVTEGSGGRMVSTDEVTIELPADAEFFDHVTLTLERSSGAGGSARVWRVTDLPVRGATRTIELTDADQAPLPHTLALYPEAHLASLDVPADWSCDGGRPNVAELIIMAMPGAPNFWMWTLLAPYATHVAMPELDPLLEPELLQDLAPTSMVARVHSVPGGMDSLAAAKFAGPPSHWLGAIDSNGPVCTTSLW